MQPEIIVYMIHCESADGDIEHYIGSTRTENFLRRMREHLSRNGAAKTKILYDTHDEWWLALVFRMRTRLLEFALHKLPSPEIICPVCNPAITSYLQQDLKILRHRKPRFEERPVLTWSSACGPEPK